MQYTNLTSLLIIFDFIYFKTHRCGDVIGDISADLWRFTSVPHKSATLSHVEKQKGAGGSQRGQFARNLNKVVGKMIRRY